MKDALTATSSLLLGMGFLMLGAGLQGTLIGVRATLESFPTVVIGAVMASYYVGYLAGSLAAPRLVLRVGHIRVFAALTSLASASILLQGVLVDPLTWGALRAVSGWCFAGIYVVAESWLNDRADNRTRAGLLGVYVAITYVGLGFGQFLLILGNPRDTTLFIMIAVLICLAAVPMSLSAQRAPECALPQSVRLVGLFRLSPLGVIAVLFSGLTAGTVFAIGPVYAARTFTASGVATFMAFSIFIAVLAQWPLGRLSDRFDRRSVLSGISLVAAVAASAAVSLGPSTQPPFFGAAVLCSGLSLTVYSLAVSHINDHLQPAQMVDASGALLLVNGIGAVIGPLLVASAMQLSGPGAYFGALAALHFGFAVYTLWRQGRRPALPDDEKKRFVAAQPQTAPTGRLATGVDPHEPR